jgi:ABC-type nitrate/sulfonate/bicarbonate transport system substrate-binding protein
MNTKMCSLVVLVAGLSLSGCKTMEGSSAAAPAAKPATPGTQYAPRIEENTAYIAQVESMARSRGLTVRWVNKPVKRHVDQE